jgi:hypothetical protein
MNWHAECKSKDAMAERKVLILSEDGVLSNTIDSNSFELDIPQLKARYPDMVSITFMFRPSSLAQWIEVGTIFLNG